MEALRAVWLILWNGGGAEVLAVAGILIIAGFWIHALTEALRREWPSPSDRTTWVLVLVLLPILGAVLYRALVPAPTARPAGR